MSYLRREGRPQWPYDCAECGQWHVSNMSPIQKLHSLKRGGRDAPMGHAYALALMAVIEQDRRFVVCDLMERTEVDRVIVGPDGPRDAYRTVYRVVAQVVASEERVVLATFEDWRHLAYQIEPLPPSAFLDALTAY
jgi:hypothetical protein